MSWGSRFFDSIAKSTSVPNAPKSHGGQVADCGHPSSGYARLARRDATSLHKVMPSFGCAVPRHTTPSVWNQDQSRSIQQSPHAPFLVLRDVLLLPPTSTRFRQPESLALQVPHTVASWCAAHAAPKIAQQFFDRHARHASGRAVVSGCCLRPRRQRRPRALLSGQLIHTRQYTCSAKHSQAESARAA